MLLASKEKVYLNQKEKTVREYKHGSKVTAICFHSNATLIATGDVNGRIVVWDTQKPSNEDDAKVFEVDTRSRITSVSFHNDQLVLTTIKNGRGTTQVWSLNTKEMLLDTKVPAVRADISPDGSKLAILRPKFGGELEVRPAP